MTTDTAADKPTTTNQYSRSRRKCACGEPALAGAYKCLTCVEQQAALRETALALLESGRGQVNISYATGGLSGAWSARVLCADGG